MSSSGGNSEELLLPLFSNSKERWGFAPNTGPACSKSGSGVQDQLCQKPADSVPGDRVSRLVNRLGGIPSLFTALGEKDINILPVPNPVSSGEPGLLQELSPPYGHDGFGTVRGPAGLAKNEGLPALGSGEASVSMSASLTQSEKYHRVCDGSSSVE